MLKKVWRGEIDLTITFWVWGVLIANVLLDVLLGLLIAATENQFLMLLHRIFVIICGVIAALALWLLIDKTEFGVRLRASVDNSDMADSLGIRTEWIYAATFALAVGLGFLFGTAWRR